MRPITQSLCLLLFVNILTSCGFKDGKAEASETLKTIMAARMSSGNLFKEEEYSWKYWKQVSKEDWEKTTTIFKNLHGALVSYEITTTDQKARKKGLSAAGWVGFNLKTKYAKGIEGDENVLFYRSGKGEPFLIERHLVLTDKMKEAQR